VIEFTNANWSLALSDASQYKGAEAELTGRVFRVEHDQGVWAYQVWTDPVNSQGNTIVGINSNQDPGIVENDYVRIKGVVAGNFQGTNAFGGSVQAPVVAATTIEKIPAEDVIAPALHTMQVNRSQSQLGLTIVLKSVDVARTETRLHVSITNGTPNKALVYASSVTAVQGSKQLKEESSFNRDYPEIPSPILPGVTVETTIVLDPVLPTGGPVKIVWQDIHTDNFNENFSDFIWTVEFQ
jgi:hypothetical protein